MRCNLKSFVAKVALPVALLALGIGLGRFFPDSSVTHAQNREPQKRKAFKSGGERSEAVLREISATLKSIDARVGRIETLIKKKRAEK